MKLLLLVLGNENTWTCPWFKLAVTSPHKLMVRWSTLLHPTNKATIVNATIWRPKRPSSFDHKMNLIWGHQLSEAMRVVCMSSYVILQNNGYSILKKNQNSTNAYQHSKISRVILNDTNVAIACNFVFCNFHSLSSFYIWDTLYSRASAKTVPLKQLRRYRMAWTRFIMNWFRNIWKLTAWLEIRLTPVKFLHL